MIRLLISDDSAFMRIAIRKMVESQSDIEVVGEAKTGQMCVEMARELRPDVTIGYFHHIPFPAHGLYAQLPWRDQVLRGLLGADVIGFQRAQDATYFLTAVRRRLRYEVKGPNITVPEQGGSRTATRISI